MLKRYRDWSIFAKVMSISLVSALLLVVAASLLLPFIRSLVMREKQHALTMNLQQATSLLDSYRKQAEAGSLPLDEAKRQAAERIGSMRYDGSNYLWIQELES
jgi:methyl-accepting chemotaxis protein